MSQPFVTLPRYTLEIENGDETAVEPEENSAVDGEVNVRESVGSNFDENMQPRYHRRDCESSRRSFLEHKRNAEEGSDGMNKIPTGVARLHYRTSTGDFKRYRMPATSSKYLTAAAKLVQDCLEDQEGEAQ